MGDLCTYTIQKVESRNNLPREGGRESDLTPGGGVLPYMGYIGMCSPKG